MSRNQRLLRYRLVNVWVGIFGDQLLPNRLTGVVYHHFLVNYLAVLLEHMPLHQRQHMWFMHDGAPPQFLRTVRQHLSQTFGEQWIRRRGPVNWPARSPDLNPLDFWPYGHLNTSVYSALINDFKVLQQRVENAHHDIRVKPRISDRVYTSVWWRAQNCVKMHVNHMEHLLQRSHGHHPPLSRYWFLDTCWVEFLAHLREYCTPLKLVTLLFNTLYISR
jgi:hypothetical protein